MSRELESMEMRVGKNRETWNDGTWGHRPPVLLHPPYLWRRMDWSFRNAETPDKSGISNSLVY